MNNPRFTQAFDFVLGVVDDIDVDNNRAHVLDSFGRRHIARVYPRRGGGPVPRVGESWILDRSLGELAFHSLLIPNPIEVTTVDEAIIALRDLGFITLGEGDSDPLDFVLDDLDDVVITDPQEDDLIHFDGENWVNFPASFNYLPLAGGVMSGDIDLDGNDLLNPGDIPGYATDAELAGSIANYLPLAGGTMAGTIDMNGNEIDMGLGFQYSDKGTSTSVYAQWHTNYIGIYNSGWNLLAYSDRTEVRKSLQATEFVIYGDSNSGMYQVATDQVGIKANNALIARFYSGGILMGASATGKALIQDSITAGYSFYGDTDTAMFRWASDEIGFVLAGNNVYRFDGPSGMHIYGVDPYTSGQAWLTLDSPSSGGSYDDQVAGITIGESGYKGSAAGHIVYTGDGYLHIGGGAVTNGAISPIQYPMFKIHYGGNRHDHVSDVSATGWAVYSNSAPGSVRLDTGSRVYQHSSSLRFKDDIQDIPWADAEEFIYALRPIIYQGRETKDYYAGLVAEELYEVEKQTPHPARFVALDDDGVPMSYGDEGITAMLIGVAQSQKSQIDLLMNRVQTLEGSNRK